MEIIKFKKKNQNEYLIYFKDKSSLSLYEDTIIAYNLLAKKNIDSHLWQEIITFNQKYVAYYQGLNFIKRKLRTQMEIKKELQKQGFNLTDINFAIKKLKSQGFINDEIYLQAYINDQVNLTNNGPKKISMNLKKLGFKEEAITKYLDVVKADEWLEKINKIISKKEKANHNLALNYLKIKIKNDLIQLGYEPNLIGQALADYNFSSDSAIRAKEINKLRKKYQNKYSSEQLEKIIKNKLYQKGFTFNDIDLDN